MELSDKALLLLVDLQNAIDHPSWGKRNNLDAEERIAELLSFWRKHNLPIIHVKHMSTNPSSYYYPGQKGNNFKAVAEPKAGEEILEKESNSAFIRTSLMQNLRGRNITDIVIAGVVTNNSVEATARMSGNLGFRTIVTSNATFTFEKRDYSGHLHSAQEVHDMSLANLSGEYAEILNSSEVINSLPISIR